MHRHESDGAGEHAVHPLGDLLPLLVAAGLIEQGRADVGRDADGREDPARVFRVTVQNQDAPRGRCRPGAGWRS